MKMHINPSNTLFLLGILSLPLFGFSRNGDDVEKKRNISKSYSVSPNDKLSIENSFGEVLITTWDKNEIKVDVEISAEASTEERAQQLLDDIEVSDSRNGNLISFKTDVGEMHDRGERHNKGKNSFHINYTVSMPIGNPLAIENSFGKIKLGDMKGEVNLTSKFGGLTTGNLDNVQDIDVEFGEASIGNIHNGKVTFKFDSKSHIEKVSGSARINSEFSGNVQFSVDDRINDLSVNESYSSVNMIVTNALSANFDVHTSFGTFHNSTDFSISEAKDEDDNGPRFDKDYSGKAGDGRAKIKIKSSFGKVRLTNSADKSQ